MLQIDYDKPTKYIIMPNPLSKTIGNRLGYNILLHKGDK